MGSCAAPSAKGDDKFITTDYLQQCRKHWILHTDACRYQNPVKQVCNRLIPQHFLLPRKGKPGRKWQRRIWVLQKAVSFINFLGT
ncbi:hypothetical protein BME68_25745 [Klebsiella pneumoniae]|nr:hypothetical protein BME68_25745 [Klebsiella pneumoniae]OVV57431.1 hypothetical protein BME67_25880 [Klebsiella pneumoniae]OVV62938.1 hypothetical protein BME66_25640 [Klebsiella pneumoniae]OVV74637.1 hypothetical protein BME64_25745 [Klebsiella pneumoniae]